VPYRTTRLETPTVTPEAGIVDDMVRQFADRYAFLRELVQNGIDAGATKLDVRVDQDAEGSVRTSVEDDGKGMSRAVIDGPLLTLFESSKENDTTKIGKYGVGFVSVFAIDPTVVEVRTRTGPEAWIVRLFRDYSWELLPDESPPSGTGTIVTIVHAVDDFSEHVDRSRRALHKWCRHARVPILFASLESEPQAINEPLGIEADAVVHSEEHGVRIFAGVSSALDSFAGYYNRGLTLFETTQPENELEGIRFKIDSPKLAHTLSRDNIRRDGELIEALDRVTSLVCGPLIVEIEARIREAAATSDPVRLSALYAATAAPAFGRKDLLACHAPLVEPIDGETTMTLHAICKRSEGPVLVADESTPLTKALARRGQPVVMHAALAPFLNSRISKLVHAVDDAVAFASAIEASELDVALAGGLASLLARLGRSVARVRLAAFSGAAKREPHRVVRADGDDAITVPGAEAEWSRKATLFLNAEDALVRIARRRASEDVSRAAYVLCRAILLHEGPIAAKDVDRLLGA
jgi:molecular chaperone HtpG